MIGTVLKQIDLPRALTRLAVWHLKYLWRKQPSPLAVGLYLTSRCNFRCSFCTIWRLTPPFTMSGAEAQQTVTDLAALKTIYFSISGGEPLLVPHVFEVLRQARKTGILYTHLVTNGYALTAERAREISRARLSEISISLDGDKNWHDQVRGMAGAYDRVVAAVENLRTHAPATTIVLNSILDPALPRMALKVLSLAESWGVRVKFQPRNRHPDFQERGEEGPPLRPPEGASEEGRPGIGNSPPGEGVDHREVSEVIARLRRHPSVANSRAFLQGYADYLSQPERLRLSRHPCLFGYHHLEIFNRQAHPCLEGTEWRRGFEYGTSGIPALLGTAAYRRVLEELRGCKKCRKNYYVCYYEPRWNFPIWNLVRSRWAQMRGTR